MPNDPSTAPSRTPLPALIGIAAVVGVAALAFAWTGGWLSPSRLTPQRMTDAIEKTGPPAPGYRRAHAKGLCISGTFDGNDAGVALSKARVFVAGSTPLTGRMSIGGGSPHGLDGSARVRSMALQLRGDDGQEWRMAMNSFPFFVVSSVEGFMAQTLASAPDPATGKPDPAKQAAFAKAYPESAAFVEWAKTAPWPTSFANTAYNGVNAFRFIDVDGGHRYVRWSMRPQTPLQAMDAEQRAAASADFLAEDFAARLAQAPLRWDMVVSIARDGDPITDPSKPWPDDREQVVVGSVVINHAEPQATGPCRDINFDPLILPAGVEGSGDPILAARSAVYSVSFNRRQHEIAAGKAAEATGNATTSGAKP